MENITAALKAIIKDVFGVDTEPVLARPDEQFGDYSTNIAMQLAGQLGKSPREIAEQISERLSFVEGVSIASIAGPGFINVTVSDGALIDLVIRRAPETLLGKTYVVEYSDPNAFKVLHAGHLYTTLVGDAIARLVQNAGASVKRVNFGGDVGLHVAKAMWAILRTIGENEPLSFLDTIDVTTRPNWVSDRYVEGNTAYENDESAKAEIIAINQKVYDILSQHDHESSFAQVYWTCRQWSYDGFEKLYHDLDVIPFDKYYPESETTPLGEQSVRELLAMGVLEQSDSAVVYKGEKDGLHTRVFQNSNGLPTYETKDLGLARRKWEDYHFDSNIIITANDIQQYMKVVLKVVSAINPEISSRTVHITHGVLKLAGGKKMSSRKGDVLLAGDILDAAAEANRAVTGDDNREIILGAVKYAFMKNRVGGDIVYDPAESVSLEGNSGPYLQYAHARACGIMKKATTTLTGNELSDVQLDSGERSLVRKLGMYAEVVEQATAELMPHIVCTYLYELAQTFNRFYEKSHVIGDPREAIRLSLVQKYARTLHDGLALLGITAPEHM